VTSDNLTSRQRVLKTLNFKKPDKLPKDLGGMASTGISAFAYPKLVAALGLPPRPPRIHDTIQMLALPDMDVLDALGCDVVTVFHGVTNAFDEPEKWQEYDFRGRLSAFVRQRSDFQNYDDGTIAQSVKWGNRIVPHRMVKSSYVFDEEHGGQPLSLTGDLHMDDLKQIRKELQEAQLRDDDIEQIRQYCKQIRESTDKAVFFNGPINTGIGIAGRGGIAVFPVLCLTEPNYVADLHEIVTTHVINTINLLLKEIHPYIDIIMMGADDWGTQSSLIASPDIFKRLFLPYLVRINSQCHKLAPNVKTFLHSCGAIYPIIDLIIESGFDILNPVQWSAGDHSYKQWKDKCRNRISLWGGGVNSQITLPLGSVEDVKKEAADVAKYLSSDNGYVFSNIHNILAEIEPEKIIAMYSVAT
jgi:uroporphyrinogen decarboxylase